MTDGPIIVINPNSTVAVTEGIDAALEGLRMAGGPDIECLTLAEGPPGIESQRHVDGVVMPLCRLAEAQDSRASAFVVASSFVLNTISGVSFVHSCWRYGYWALGDQTTPRSRYAYLYR